MGKSIVNWGEVFWGMIIGGTLLGVLAQLAVSAAVLPPQTNIVRLFMAAGALVGVIYGHPIAEYIHKLMK